MRHERLPLSRGRWLSIIEVAAIALLAVALVAAGAPVFEAASESAAPFDPVRAQELAYRDLLLSALTAAALALTGVHAFVMRAHGRAFGWSLAAVCCLLAAQVVASIFPYPLLEPGQTLPAEAERFEAARRQWQYAHEAGLALDLLALLAMVLSVQASRPRLSVRVLDAIGENIKARAARARALAGRHRAHDR